MLSNLITRPGYGGDIYLENMFCPIPNTTVSVKVTHLPKLGDASRYLMIASIDTNEGDTIQKLCHNFSISQIASNNSLYDQEYMFDEYLESAYSQLHSEVVAFGYDYLICSLEAVLEDVLYG